MTPPIAPPGTRRASADSQTRWWSVVRSVAALAALTALAPTSPGSADAGRESTLSAVVTRHNGRLTEFVMNRSDGLLAEQVLPVYRPSAGYGHVGDVTVSLVDERQAVAKEPPNPVRDGDIVVWLRPGKEAVPEVLPEDLRDPLVGTWREITLSTRPPVPRGGGIGRSSTRSGGSSIVTSTRSRACTTTETPPAGSVPTRGPFAI